MKFREEIITSRNNPTVKWAASLSDKKGRAKYSTFIAEGEKLTFEAISASLPVTHIFVSESKSTSLIPKLRASEFGKMYDNTEVLVLSDSAFEKISTEKAPQGVISAIKYLDFFSNMDIIYKEEFFLKDNERALFLCSLRDPGNLGSVIRSAVAFGVEHIIMSADSADIYNPKTVRSAMGSLFRTRVTTVGDVSSFVISAKENGRRVFAAELTEGAKALSDINITSKDIVIIGNEGHGIPAEISALCDNSVYIPISAKTESLNASVAAAIFMWEQSK